MSTVQLIDCKVGEASILLADDNLRCNKVGVKWKRPSQSGALGVDDVNCFIDVDHGIVA